MRNRYARTLLAMWMMIGCVPPAMAFVPEVPRQSPDDAWFTGSLLANSAATLPRGHWLIEPYLYDATSHDTDSYGSLTYMLYGLTDRLTVGLMPVLGYNRAEGAANSSGIGLGDAGILAQYRLMAPPVESSLPTVSIQLKETLPTGKYDRLGNHSGDGLGSGAHVATLALNTQTWFWLANGRILRMRFNVSRTFTGRADVTGTSVYGTPQGFRGHARPGDTFGIIAAWEYSLDRHWALALDLTWSRSEGTRVTGRDTPDIGMTVPVYRTSSSSKAFGFAPGVEYHWSSSVGLIAGVRIITGPRTPTTVTPVVAVNIVH